jgi:hypothetical protein
MRTPRKRGFFIGQVKRHQEHLKYLHGENNSAQLGIASRS